VAASVAPEKPQKPERNSRWIARKPIGKFRKMLAGVPDYYLPKFIQLVAEILAPRCESDQQLSRYLQFCEDPEEGKVIQMGTSATKAKRKFAAITSTSDPKESRARAQLLSADGLLASAVQAAHNGHYIINLDNWGPEIGGRLPQRKCSLGLGCLNHSARTSKACVCQPAIALCPKHCFAQHCVRLGVAQKPEDAASVAASAVRAMPAPPAAAAVVIQH